MQKVFVAGLSWNTDERGLSAHFSQIGTVEDAVVVKDRDTRKSRGFGFVTFASSEEANRAVQELDGSLLDGRNIKVNMARERR